MAVKIKNLGDEWWIEPGDLRVLAPDLTAWWGHICMTTHKHSGFACTRRHGHTGRHAAGLSPLGVRAVWR